jgi:cytochrome P450
VDRDIAAECVADIDHHSREYRHQPEKWGELRDRCPVAWNPRHGGFWMVTDYEGVARVSRDSETFAHRYEPDAPDGIDYIGIGGIPRWPGRPRMGLIEDDGEDHAEMRRALNPLFAPSPIENERPKMQAVAAYFLDQKIESGSIDLILDYANPVPAVITLQRMGLPIDNWQLWSHTMHNLLAYPVDTPEHAEAARDAKLLQDEMAEATLRRRVEPRDDPTTAIANLKLHGELLSEEDLGRVMWTVTVGGLNTTTAVSGIALQYLAAHPKARQQLVDHPELWPSATEEFLRYSSVQRSNSRTVSCDVELGGQQLHRGDRVLVYRHSANFDPKEFERPDEVILDRAENRHLAFGMGPHRCIGSHVGRVMVQVLLSEIVNRIPDYTIDDDGVRPYDGSPSIMGLLGLRASFTSGPVRGARSPFTSDYWNTAAQGT